MSTRRALHPKVALRPEPFGALAYHYGNRRLNFLRSPDLVAVVRCLGDHDSARAAYAACDIDPRRWPSFDRALDALAASEFLQEVPS
ncbi:MAG: mycofactocin biosynthesis chaperone MftB [Acidimicrobiales bacterium]